MNNKFKTHAEAQHLVEKLKKLYFTTEKDDEFLKKFCNYISEFFDDDDVVITVGLENKDLFTCHKKQNLNLIAKLDFFTKSNTSAKLKIFSSKQKNFSDKIKILEFIFTQIPILIKNTEIKTDIEQQKIYNENQSSQNIASKLRQVLHYQISNKNYYERDIFHDLMPYKVKEILLVAHLFDAFTFDSEGNLTQRITKEFSNLNLTSIPRITTMLPEEDIYTALKQRFYDMVIINVGIGKYIPKNLCNQINQYFPSMPIFLLLNSDAYIRDFEKLAKKCVDQIFVWNGDSRIFLTMIKLLEDRINLDNDTKRGDVRIILLVEDSIRYYSTYLPELYMNIFQQTQRIIEDITTLDELYKVLRLRARPKVLLATSYEEAIEIFDKYKDYMLAVITDVEFSKNGKTDKTAGIQLAKYVKKQFDIDFTVVIQSSDPENKKIADELNCSFIYKHSYTLSHDINNIIKYNMGFGDFIYKDEYGNKLRCPDNPEKYCIARTLEDFEKMLDIVPDSTLRYHAERNHFSLWLRARGEFKIADQLAKISANSLTDTEIRHKLKQTIREIKYEKNKGKILEFRESEFKDPSNIVSLATGAFGGKGRGIAFIHTLVHRFNIETIINSFINKDLDINIRTPFTFFIGTDEYDRFIEENELDDIAFNPSVDYKTLRKKFLEAKLSDELIEKLKILLKQVHTPLAVRSSGLFEDSLLYPFAGIFETYLVPNSHSSFKERLNQLTSAIKMVYSSVFSDKARSYINSINYRIEEEKMAIVIQEVVGNKYENYFYPHISGVAQSVNYYPFSYIKPEDGFAAIALGLGIYVVEGEKAFRFCPKYPKLQNQSLEDLLENSQSYFYAVDLTEKKLNYLEGEEVGIAKLDIEVAEKHGTLKHLASVYDPDSNRLDPGLYKPGPRILDFSNILKYNYIPLAPTLDWLLKIGKSAYGTDVEIEFAVDLNKNENGKASIYLLQIKPLIGNKKDFEIDQQEIEQLKDKMLLYTTRAMGNGMIDNIYDVVFVKKDTFDKHYTKEMAQEIGKINEKFAQINKIRKEKKQPEVHYILLGPGRWGSRDPWIGIPVAWNQISEAKVIVEMSLDNFPLQESAGSHFFHNIVSSGIGYFTVYHYDPENYKIRWDLMENQQVVYESKFIKHIRFKEPLVVKIDGRKRFAYIIKKSDLDKFEAQNEK